ncbi:D-tyrosyl-tRNA(Tyr) deacylase [Phlyctochytrium bullatum]|nr:D-tyrosyl-tRNA(Tyr) deacylase [Phlyctochytrium bullatum]
MTRTKKILNLRLFDSSSAISSSETSSAPEIPDQPPSKPWSKSVMDCGMEVLCVSQFTLYALTSKGSKPDFHLAMKSDSSRDMYHRFLDKMKAAYAPEKIKGSLLAKKDFRVFSNQILRPLVIDGVFGAMMQVNIANDGPVTILLESPSLKEQIPSSPAVSAKSPTPSQSSVASSKPRKEKGSRGINNNRKTEASGKPAGDNTDPSQLEGESPLEGDRNK